MLWFVVGMKNKWCFKQGHLAGRVSNTVQKNEKFLNPLSLCRFCRALKDRCPKWQYRLWSFKVCNKGQLNSEWIYEVIISPKIQTKNYKDFCPTKQTRIVAKKTAYTHQKITKTKCYDSCLYGRAEIFVIFGLYFGRNDDLINSFWI